MSLTRYDVMASCPNVDLMVGLFAGGGAAADMTKVFGDGIASVKYNAATGNYRITWADNAGKFLGLVASVGSNTTSTANEKVINFDADSVSQANKTVDIFITDVATPTAKDLATTDQLFFVMYFARSGGLVK